MSEKTEKEEESSKPDPENDETTVPNKKSDSMQSHADILHQAISRMEVHRRRKFHFLTIPGILRTVELFISLLNISVFGYYCTRYYEVKNMLPPFCMAQTREQYFILSNYHSLMGCVCLVVAGIISSFSNAAMTSSLYPLIFDSIQAATISISSVALMYFYRANSEKIAEVMPEGATFKEGMAKSSTMSSTRSRSTHRSSSRRSLQSTRSILSPSSTPSSRSLPNAPSSSVMPTISGLLRKIDSTVVTGTRSEPPPDAGLDPSSTSVRDLLHHNTESVMQARSRLEAGRRQVFYFLTMPGLIRILEVFFAVIHVGVFGYYCTYYENIVAFMLPPFFIAHAREQFFMLSNYHSLLGCMVIILAGVFSAVSNTALLSSLYPLIFDFIQFLTVASSSVALLQFYTRFPALIAKEMPTGAPYKQAMAITGLILASLHVISIGYDWVVFIKRIKILRMERDALRREDEATVRS